MMTAYMIEEKDEIELAKKFIPYLKKLEKSLLKSGIHTYLERGNALFRKEDKQLRISYTYLYRQSGIKSIHREKTENLIEMIDITDDAFYENYVKATINLFFSK